MLADNDNQVSPKFPSNHSTSQAMYSKTSTSKGRSDQFSSIRGDDNVEMNQQFFYSDITAVNGYIPAAGVGIAN